MTRRNDDQAGTRWQPREPESNTRSRRAWLAAVMLRVAGAGSADRHRGDPSGPVPDRLPDDPDDRLAVPAAGDRRLRPRAGRARHPQPARPRQPAGCRRGSRLRAGHPRRLPAVGLDRVVRVQGGPHHRRHRRRRDRGGGFRGPGRARARSCPRRRGGGPGGGGSRPRPDSPPRSRRRSPGRPQRPPRPWRLRRWCCSASRWPGPSRRRPPHEHGHGPEDHHDRRDDGPDQRQGLHPLLVRPRHPDHFEMLRKLRRLLAAGDRHRPGQPGPARHGSARSPGPTAPASSPTTGTRCTPTSATAAPARPTATTSTSTAACGTRCPSPGKTQRRERHARAGAARGPKVITISLPLA